MDETASLLYAWCAVPGDTGEDEARRVSQTDTNRHQAHRVCRSKPEPHSSRHKP